jgi:hypothetical protein
LQYEKSWDKSLPYAEFSYNNNYQESLKMAPFEMLCGRRCQTPLFWSETGERNVFAPDILQEAEKQVRMLGRTCESHNRGIRATLIIGEES